jgi:3-oxoacyl-[acyl-carrier-protein] synthase-3
MVHTSGGNGRDTRAVTEEPAAPGTAGPPYVSRIESVGLALPSARLTTADLLKSRRHRFPLDLERYTGIAERRVCTNGEDSATLAVDAARNALVYSRHGAADLDMVLVCSITRWVGGLTWRVEPSLSSLVREAVGAERAVGYDVSNACAGMLTGVHLMNQFIASGVVRRGMVVSGEYISSLGANAARTMRTPASKQLASLTVGDAGAAVILERGEPGSAGITASELATIAEHSDLCIGTPCEDGPGATMVTHANSLHRAAIANSPETIHEALERSGASPDTIDHVIPHQTSTSAIKAGIKHSERKVGHYSGDVVYNLAEFGNTASTTHFAALHRCLVDRRFKPGDRVMMICSASGLTVGALVFTIDEELCERYGRRD